MLLIGRIDETKDAAETDDDADEHEDKSNAGRRRKADATRCYEKTHDCHDEPYECHRSSANEMKRCRSTDGPVRHVRDRPPEPQIVVWGCRYGYELKPQHGWHSRVAVMQPSRIENE